MSDKETICDVITAEDDDHDMPLGLEMSMVLHEHARENFMKLSKAERDRVEDYARTVHSKQEMEELVTQLAEGKFLN